MAPDVVSVCLRALSFMALLQASGICVFVSLFRPYLAQSEAGIRRLGVFSAAAALPLLAGQYLLEAARMTGEMAGSLDVSLQHLVLRSPMALTLAARIAGLALIGVALRIRGRHSVAGAAGVLLVAASFALMGHTAVNPWRPLLAPAVTAHVLIAAFWFGALPALYIVTKRDAPGVAGQAIEAFSRFAVRVVPILAVLGLMMGVIFIRHVAVLREPYGWLLFAKLIGFGGLMGLAAANKSRFGPAVAAGEPKAFRQALIAEYAMIAVILSITAALTALYSPE